MAYLSPEFRHDIFFSYPHADVDKDGNSELKAWSQRFAEDLRRGLLTSRKHQALSFFLDQGARDGQRLDETATPRQALEEAASAAILMSLMSPWYLGSHWCKEEREAWAGGTDEETARVVNEVGRTFIVRVQDTAGEPWPPEFADTELNEKLGFWLYERAEGEFAAPIGSIGDDEDKGKYKRILARIRQTILKRLDEIHGRLEAERKKKDNVLGLLGQRTDGFTTVYVHARPTAAAAFDQTCAQLVETDFYPIPARPEPLRPDGRLTDKENERLQTADALLVLGTQEDDLLMDIAVVGKHALRLAKAETPKLLPGAVLDKIGAPSTSDALQPRARIAGLHWLDGGSAAWTAALRDYLIHAVSAEAPV